MNKLRNIVAILLLYSISSSAQQWNPPKQITDYFGSGTSASWYSSAAIVNGNPAIVFYDHYYDNLVYIRATDATGSAWGAPVLVDSKGDVGGHCRLLVVNGKPAISYMDQGTNDLKYVRAQDANGTTWAAPIVVAAQYAVGAFNSLAIINGNPAISYWDQTNQDLKYVRARDADGSAWGLAQSVRTMGIVGLSSCLLEVQGKPAIAYRDDSPRGLSYIRSADANGAVWHTPVSINSTIRDANYVTMKIIEGKPAVAYFDPNGYGSLKYAYASDSFGGSWPFDITVDTSKNVGAHISLEIIDGMPAISYGAYHPATQSLRFVRATTKTGTTWGMPTKVLGSNPGSFISMVIADGNPALSFTNDWGGATNYVRATNSTGTSWGTPYIFDLINPKNTNPSIIVINNKPVIVFSSRYLKYITGSDSLGSSWSTPVVVDSTINASGFVEMDIIEVAKYPAIAYYDQQNTNLNYIRAKNENGTDWETPVVVDGVNTTGESPNMMIVKGHPAISYKDSWAGDLNYVRALDSFGNIWGTPVRIPRDMWITGYESDIAIVDGHSAIAYTSARNSISLYYIRSSDDTGGVWTNPICLDSIGNLSSPKLKVVNGNPVIAYLQRATTFTKVKYLQAIDAKGAVWPISNMQDIRAYAYKLDLETIEGVPVIGYGGVADYLVVTAKDKQASSWHDPVSIHSNRYQAQYGNIVFTKTNAYATCLSDEEMIDFILGSIVGPVGMQTIVWDNAEMKLVPNPAQERVIVKWDKQYSGATITLTNVVGQVVMKQQVPNNNKQATLSIVGMPSGVYVVTLNNKDIKLTQKLIKE